MTPNNTDSKVLRRFRYKPHSTYTKVNHAATMKRIDFIGHQLEAITEALFYLFENLEVEVPDEVTLEDDITESDEEE